jgi:HAMP domain-containing protein
MFVLDSVQILSAVRRSLANHVLPELRDDFARVQVLQALKSIEEVEDRLSNGDPSERSNQIVESEVRALAESLRGDAPEFASKLDAALAAAPPGGAPRERARQLGESLWQLVIGGEEPGAGRLLALLQQEAVRILGEDTRWICPEAIQSLT